MHYKVLPATYCNRSDHSIKINDTFINYSHYLRGYKKMLAKDSYAKRSRPLTPLGGLPIDTTQLFMSFDAQELRDQWVMVISPFLTTTVRQSSYVESHMCRCPSLTLSFSHPSEECRSAFFIPSLTSVLLVRSTQSGCAGICRSILSHARAIREVMRSAYLGFADGSDCRIVGLLSWCTHRPPGALSSNIFCRFKRSRGLSFSCVLCSPGSRFSEAFKLNASR